MYINEIDEKNLASIEEKLKDKFSKEATSIMIDELGSLIDSMKGMEDIMKQFQSLDIFKGANIDTKKDLFKGMKVEDIYKLNEYKVNEFIEKYYVEYFENTSRMEVQIEIARNRDKMFECMEIASDTGEIPKNIMFAWSIDKDIVIGA